MICPLPMLGRNSSIGVETMRDQINSLFVGREKFSKLDAARATDITIIQAGKQSNLYTSAIDLIPWFPKYIAMSCLQNQFQHFLVVMDVQIVHCEEKGMPRIILIELSCYFLNAPSQILCQV